MNHKMLWALILALLLLFGCGEKAAAPQPAQKEGVVFVDPNAATAVPAATAEPVSAEATAAPAEATPEPEAAPAGEPEEPPAVPELYFESKGVRMEPWMEAAPVLAALGDPIGSFEADSCAYIGKDVFYYYPGFELTVNEVDGQNTITAIAVVDDTVTIPQGLRIYDEEEKLLSILGEAEENGVYTYESGHVLLLIQVKTAEDGVRRIATMEYRAAEEG